MKRALLLSLIGVLALSALAFAQSFQPYFGMENVGVVAQPVVMAGAIIEGTLDSAWSIALDVGYEDPNALDQFNPWDINFGVEVGFDQRATVNETGSVKYGASFEFDHTATYNLVNYPNQLGLLARTAGFMATGYVGPLSLWGGAEFPWVVNSGWLTIIPTVGFEVLFDFPL